jgi:hypothetical protein
MRAFLVFLLALAPAGAQEIKVPPSFDRLAARAVEKVDITLDGSLLQFACKFLSERDPDEAEAKKLVSGLRGIVVKSFKFDQPGQYTESDVEAIRSQLQGPGWSRMMGILNRSERVELYARTEDKRVTGVVILATQPRELTLVNIAGAIDLDRLSELGGRFGIPRVEVERKPRAK